MVHYCTVADVTTQEYKKFTENYRSAILEFMSKEKGGPQMTLEVIKTVDGKDIIHQRMDPGIFMVSARSVIVQQYQIDLGNDEHIFFTSSKDSAEYEKEFTK